MECPARTRSICSSLVLVHAGEPVFGSFARLSRSASARCSSRTRSASRSSAPPSSGSSTNAVVGVVALPRALRGRSARSASRLRAELSVQQARGAPRSRAWHEEVEVLHPPEQRARAAACCRRHLAAVIAQQARSPRGRRRAAAGRVLDDLTSKPTTRPARTVMRQARRRRRDRLDRRGRHSRPAVRQRPEVHPALDR